MFSTSNKNSNAGEKRQAVQIGSKKESELSFHQLYKTLCNSISEQKLEELQESLKKVNEEIIVSFDKIDLLLQKRQEASSKISEKLRNGISDVIGKVEESMTDVLQGTMQEGEENMENWKLLNAKKMNYEKMHQNLLEIKRKSLDFGFIRRGNK